MHYYQFNIGDYRKDTLHLTLLEHGIYRQLLDLYYLNECELNANALRLICARSAEEVKAAEIVLSEFFIKTENGWKHKRCDCEIIKFKEKSEKARASADARWSNKNADAMRTHSEGNANHKPITNNHKPIIKDKSICAEPVGSTLEIVKSESKIVIELPLNKTGLYFPVTETMINELSQLYPAIDVMQQFRNMLGWLNSNQERRKTSRGINAFINRWLSKAQDNYKPPPISSALKGDVQISRLSDVYSEFNQSSDLAKIDHDRR